MEMEKESIFWINWGIATFAYHNHGDYVYSLTNRALFSLNINNANFSLELKIILRKNMKDQSLFRIILKIF